MNDLESLSKIFQNKLFRIPDYQRGYAWTKSNLIDFWEDIENLLPNHNHYTGMLSIKENKEYEEKDDKWLIDSSGYTVYSVIDGQQRLTTSIILINEIISFIKNLPENKEKKDDEIYIGYDTIAAIKAKYILRQCPPYNISTSYIFGYENDNPSSEYLKHVIFEQNPGFSVKETYYTKNLKKAKEFFSDAIHKLYDAEKIEGIEKIYSKLTLKLMFNIHIIDDEYDEFVAFETMNNRGKPLTNLELLKNRLIYLTTLYDESKLKDCDKKTLRKNINNAWKEIYTQLGRNEKTPLSDDDFLKAHWTYYFKYSRKKGDDYIKFLLKRFSQESIFGKKEYTIEDEDSDATPISDYMDDDEVTETEINAPEEKNSFKPLMPNDISDYVKSLQEYAVVWYYSFYPYESTVLTTEEKVWIDKLNKINIAYFRPLIAVSMLSKFNFTAEKRISLFKAVERFIFINFRLGNSQSSYKSSEFYNKTRDLYHENITIEEYINDLNNISDENIQSSITSFINKMNQKFNSNEGFYGWNSLKYFLYEYEYEIAQKSKVEKLDWAVLTKVVKDQITIEHILPQTPTKYYWKNQFRQYSDDEIEILTNSLGNLLPLSHSMNSKIQNNDFAFKKGYYKDGSHSEIEVSQLTDWSAEEILNRGLKLLEFMERRWDISFESIEQKEKLLHIEFVNEERDYIEPLNEEEFIESTDENLKELRIKYWTLALPKLKQAHGGNGAFSKLAATDVSYKDGNVGIRGLHLYCKAGTKLCTAGIWIDTSFKAENERIYQVIYSHKDEIEAKLSIDSLEWDNSPKKRSKSINAILKDVDLKDENCWEKMSDFQAKLSKELYDYALLPYKEDIEKTF